MKTLNTLQAVDLASYIFKQGYKSNIQINKLLYIAFGFYGAETGKYLFNDVIEAWRYGPVVPTVYYAFNNYELTHKLPKLNKNVQNVMDEVLDFYGKKAPFLLVELTHQEGSPWQNVYVDGVRNIEIPKQTIIDYYAKFLDKTKKTAKAIATPEFYAVMEELAKT